MKRSTRLGILVLVSAILSVTLAPLAASAHPMGNFSINRYSAITVGQDRVDLRYIVDMAEIPAFQELATIREDRSTELTSSEREAYLSDKSAELSSGLQLSVDGRRLPLELRTSSLSFPPGNGGLPTLRMELEYSAALNGITAGNLDYVDGNFTGRVGWQEVIARAAPGTTLQESSVPSADITNGLTIYSPDATTSPLTTTKATLRFAPGTASALPPAGAGQTSSATQERPGALGWAQQRIDDVASLIAQDELPLGAMLVGLLLAFFWGAGHALSPGHGKTVVAAYLVGTRGTAKHAALLGLTVTVSHTIGVFALGLVVLFAADFIVPDALYPLIGVASGLLIVTLGLVMFVQRWRAWRATRVAPAGAHSHDHDDAGVPHTHGPFGKPHTHLPADSQKVTTGSLLALGIMGGIIPCPTALVVLLAAIAYHRVALGLAWILAFSLGLATVLTLLGLLVVYGRSFIGRFSLTRFRLTGLVLGKLPMASAALVAVLGFIIVFQSLQVG